MPSAPSEDPLLALLPKARRAWARKDPVLARIAKEHPPTERSIGRKDGFAALAESITHQQVSIHAGRAIFGRLEAACGGVVTPAAVLDLGVEGMRAAGLSRPKAAYAMDLAQRTASGEVDFARFETMADDEVVAALTAVKGIGVWTAKMHLLFHLQRPDVLPHEDLGVQIAVADAYDVPREEAAAKIRELGPAWSPYASVAALTLWNWRRLMVEA